ncbi:MAG: hypothetical protein U1F23_09530 [Lysobacterales bacterium]
MRIARHITILVIVVLLAEDDYFHKAGASFSAVRRRMKRGAILAQMIAFSSLSGSYAVIFVLRNGQDFRSCEIKVRNEYGEVPGRSWYANYKGSPVFTRTSADS